MTNRSMRSTTGKRRPTRRIAAIALLAPLAVALAPAVPAHGQEVDGRRLVGVFCTNPQALPKPGACISLSYGGLTAVGYTGSANRVLTLRPGTYWLSVRDDSAAHNFSLAGPDGVDQDVTGIADVPGWVTVRIHLDHGSYTLFCDADDHRADGMYVDIEVGGVGQVG